MANTKKKGGLGAESYFENIPTLAPAEERETTTEAEAAEEVREESVVDVVDGDAEILVEVAELEVMAAEAEAAEEDVAVTYVEVHEEEAEMELQPAPETTEEVPRAEEEAPEQDSTDSEDEEAEEPDEDAEPPQRQKIRRTYALYEETQIALEEMKLAARKQGVKKTLGDLLEEAVQLLMEKKGMVQDSKPLDY